MTTDQIADRITEATDMLNLIMACPPPRTSLDGPAVDTGTHCTDPRCSCQRRTR